MTYNEIAEKLNISTSTVHIRIKKLETLNIIQDLISKLTLLN